MLNNLMNKGALSVVRKVVRPRSITIEPTTKQIRKICVVHLAPTQINKS